MHKLEYAIFALATIQEKEKKNLELGKELELLASISHNYKEPQGPNLDLSDEYMEELHKRADHLIHG